MILVFYHEEQDVMRLYSTCPTYECWTDMEDLGYPRRLTSLTKLIGWGYVLIGEL